MYKSQTLRISIPPKHPNIILKVYDWFSEEKHEFYYAIRNRDVSKVKYFLDKHGNAMVNSIIEFVQITPLYTAMINGTKEIILLLLEHGADPLIKNSSGGLKGSAFSRAVELSYFFTVQLFLMYGANSILRIHKRNQSEDQMSVLREFFDKTKSLYDEIHSCELRLTENMTNEEAFLCYYTIGISWYEASLGIPESLLNRDNSYKSYYLQHYRKLAKFAFHDALMKYEDITFSLRNEYRPQLANLLDRRIKLANTEQNIPERDTYVQMMTDYFHTDFIAISKSIRLTLLKDISSLHDKHELVCKLQSYLKTAIKILDREAELNIRLDLALIYANMRVDPDNPLKYFNKVYYALATTNVFNAKLEHFTLDVALRYYTTTYLYDLNYLTGPTTLKCKPIDILASLDLVMVALLNNKNAVNYSNKVKELLSITSKTKELYSYFDTNSLIDLDSEETCLLQPPPNKILDRIKSIEKYLLLE